ncbi:MAG: hypothetical protein HONBIEJF_01155 [Fimbriimonadaceae bacterium]|nr:hypothetical protein [Fimbriimonadaceae bacterium]
MPKTVFYTFGNHMHWVDMEWLWGYDVLPGSARDMLRFCREAGVRGNVNFDGVGYEKLASESPQAFAELKQAVDEGHVEIVGGSYGQPYGLFHGAESNIRQRVYGVRTVERLFGVRPNTFWEEEFDCFPQLPQILKQCGYAYASLFFQWTWHTPEIPQEASPVIWWEGIDGSRLLTASRHRHNLHQWPEEFDGLLDEVAQSPGEGPAFILQWLELMPSPDWMCRSELLLPRMKSLMEDERFVIQIGSLSNCLEELKTEAAPARRYGVGDIWHGLTLGKNGDRMRRLSSRAESHLLSAESLAATMGLFGRPYAQWDVYPLWELEEAWRELLVAQHHDNDECEGLCGHIGRTHYERSLNLSQGVLERNLQLLAERIDAPIGSLVLFNPVAFERSDVFPHPGSGGLYSESQIQPMGFTAIHPGNLQEKASRWKETATGVFCGTGTYDIAFDRGAGKVSLDWKTQGPRIGDLFELTVMREGKPITLRPDRDWLDLDALDWVIRYPIPGGGHLEAWLKPFSGFPDFDLTIKGFGIAGIDPGLNGGISVTFNIPFTRLRADSPMAFEEVRPVSGRRKYPTGDWMTSPQWFEEVTDTMHVHSCLQLWDGDRCITVAHDGSPMWFVENGRVRCLLTTYDPWDEQHHHLDFRVDFRLSDLVDSDTGAWRLAQTLRRPTYAAVKRTEGGDIPAHFSALSTSPESSESVVVQALYRERSSLFVEEPLPFFVRLVNLSEQPARGEPRVAKAPNQRVETNLLGERIGDRGNMFGPWQIRTFAYDLPSGRKQVRDLDAKREVWATIHRSPEKP